MRVIRGRNAGFCMGVALALRKLDEAVTSAPRRVATLGAIIHNPQVLAEYAARGVRVLHSPAEAEPGMTVVIRAHGVPREDEARLLAVGARVVDATCPRVKKAQMSIAEATAGGAQLWLYGDAEHPEVRGLLSYAAGSTRVFASCAEAACLPATLPPDGTAVLAAQTTQDRPAFDALRADLLEAMESRLRVLDTICDATRQRQQETLNLAEQVDALVVVGGRASGNTRRLADIAAGRGVPALLVETADDLESAFFSSVSVVGLTAGASTPKSLIDAVEQRLKELCPR
ncbi:MAG: 4-hydroxy-3-methylbut-2-enyl diphosphate reductase [Desulfovibrionaceae bacterium]|nr:4-hydroxy-3-methylbut-2-enyl diphosphate reductase [Desulfovibrionaceae bacterium]